MALHSCYECNKEISTKAIMCPQCGAPQNPVSGLADKVKDGFLGKTFNKVKNNIREIARNKEIERIIEENLEQWIDADETPRVDPEGRIESTKNIVKWGMLHDPHDPIIKDFMKEMEIECNVDTRVRIFEKLVRMRERDYPGMPF
jgi:hypothetical protein